MSDLVVELDTPFPESLRIGKGNALFVRGRCYHPDEPLRTLGLVLDGKRYGVAHHSVATPEVLDGTVRVDERGFVLRSTFWTHVPIGALAEDRTVHVVLEATMRSGAVARRVLGDLRLVANDGASDVADAAPLVACIATSDPDVDALRDAIAVSGAAWIVQDDRSSEGKYRLMSELDAAIGRNARREGPVATIEHALARVPREARTVAVVDTASAVLVATLAEMLDKRDAVAVIDRNASRAIVFRRTILDDLLPFPPDAGAFDIGTWVATVAGARGRVVVLGGERSHVRLARSGVRAALVSAARSSSTLVSYDLAQKEIFATVAQLRTGRKAAGRPALRPLAAVAAVRLLNTAFRLRGAQMLERRAQTADAAPSIDAQVGKIEHDMAPLRLAVSESEPVRLNVVIPMIDFRYVFGAYLTIFHLLVALRSRGVRSRLVIVQERPVDQGKWRSELARYPGIEDLLDHVEVVDATDRSRALDVNAGDAFLATTSWTAHVASAAARELGRERFAFLVLEYDPLVHPTGSLHELSARAYDLPHDAIFSTELLRKYFRESGLGVFRHGGMSVAVDNPIDTHELRIDRAPAGVLLYARPEAHAQRNLFEIAVLALRRVADRLPGWRVDGIGSLQPFSIALGDGVDLNVLQRVPLDRYLETLEHYDVGIALQATPHPGLVALDMAASGLVTVTNTYATKSADDLTQISSNLVVAEATIESVARSIGTAIDRASDTAGRIRGAALKWPRTWDEALNLDEILALPSLRLG